jgi:molecular chaperone GrpE
VTPSDAGRPEEQERVVIRDNRKIDPVTGEARKASSAPASSLPAAEPSEGPTVDAALLDERTRDLQRVQAEYANYRKRAERERLAAGESAVGRALTELLPVLDDLDRAREHGDITGNVKAVADKLEDVLAKLGLVSFGEVGDPFDPVIHEAVLHNEDESVAEPTCTLVMRRGYRHGERLLRAAMVGVSEPAAPPGLGEHPLEREADEATVPEGDQPVEGEDSATDATPPEDEGQGKPGEPG